MFQDRKSLHEPRTMEELHAAAIVIATANLPGRWERVVGWTVALTVFVVIGVVPSSYDDTLVKVSDAGAWLGACSAVAMLTLALWRALSHSPKR